MRTGVCRGSHCSLIVKISPLMWALMLKGVVAGIKAEGAVDVKSVQLHEVVYVECMQLHAPERRAPSA